MYVKRLHTHARAPNCVYVYVYAPFVALTHWIYTFLNHLGDGFLKRLH